MAKSLKVLIIDDSEDDFELILRELKHSGYDPESERVDLEKAMTKALNNSSWDVIISDYSMPHFTGIEALQIYHELKLDIPFIIISGVIGDDLAVDIVKLGAHDYILKDNLRRLRGVLERELKQYEEKRSLIQQLNKDSLDSFNKIKDWAIEEITKLKKINSDLRTENIRLKELVSKVKAD